MVWVVIMTLLIGCGRIITPTPVAQISEAAAPTAATVTATATTTPLPTETPRPATPAPSPTVTPTATPIFYAVQSGDTLLSIAIAFDTSTEAIQEINGIIDPRFLQIGQELIIPQPTTGEEAAPSPTPTPLPLVVEAINFQETQQGTLWGLGEVSNPGEVPIAEVVIEAALFDGAGVLLAREATFTQLDVIQPGQTVPFAILFETPPSSFAQYQVTALTGVPLSEQTRYHFDLEVFDLQGAPAGVSAYRLAGQLRNVGPADVEAIRLVAVAYDENGRVLVQRQAQLAVTLLKTKATTPFEIDLMITQGVVSHYKVLAQGLKVE